MDFADRLRAALGDRSVYSLAQEADIDQSLIRKYLARKSKPGIDKVVALAKAARVRQEWLATGDGPMRSPDQERQLQRETMRGGGARIMPGGYAAIEQGLAGGVLDEAIRVPLIELRRAEEGSPSKIGLILPESTLGRVAALAPEVVAAVATGDAMQPTIRDGDRVIIDPRRAKAPLRDGVYAFNAEGELLIRRLRRRVDGALEVRCDNPAHPEVSTLTDDDAASIVGLVVWRGGAVS